MTPRFTRLSIVVMAVLIGAASVASAGSVIYAADTDLLDQLLTEMEIPYELVLDEAGDPGWVFTYKGILITVAAYDKAATGKYESLLFYAGWVAEREVSLAAINGWNRRARFGRAYLDELGDPVVELDLLLSGGVTAGTVTAYIDLFVGTVSDVGVELGL